MLKKSLFLSAIAFTTACAAPPDEASVDDILSYEAFRERAYFEEETGYAIINGDELAETEVDLEDAYMRYVDTELGLATVEQSLVVNRVGNADDLYSAAAAANITYCFDTRSFGNNLAAVTAAMNAAAAAWEGSARVNFVHSAAQDGSCTNRNNNVVFNVRKVNTNGYLARAFFPSSGRAARELLVSASAFRSIAPWTLAGILTHELGHAVGFRHEHTRPEAGTCFEDNNWRALTPYDRNSVMHYPQCNGGNSGDLALTADDRAGATSVYP
ncbi:MAG: hypothetical protein EXR76_14350 [Myxococcales bacterium]|nr:hypothetical protein [Myxococcales bacterium]